MADFVLVPDNFGTGGSGLTPNFSSGVPWLGQILVAQQTGQSTVAQDADGDADANAQVIIVDSSGGTVAVNLPTIVGNVGRTITVKRVGASNVTIVPDGSETIDGTGGPNTLATTLDWRTVVADATGWHIVASV